MFRVFCIVIFILSLSACSPAFNGSRTGNDREFIMEYKVFNTTDCQDLSLKAGDTIHAKIVVDGGSLAIKIQKDDEEPVYESDGISISNEFDVTVEESGTYTVKLTGKKARGSVNFMVTANQ